MNSMDTSPKPGLCGFLNVLKPPGMSSAQTVARVRRLLCGEKTGHAGTLDPEASGVLPLMIGKAARLFDYLQDKEKAYIAEIAFGYATDTQDAQGKAIAMGDAYPDENAIRAALPRFTGEQLQTPPMYSALSVNGQRLYHLARQGKTVAVAARPVTVNKLELLDLTSRHGALISVRCSKGFYVRTLCADLGEALGCPAHMRFLLRTQSGAFTLETAHTLEEIAESVRLCELEKLLVPMEMPISHLPRVTVPRGLEKPFLNGVPLSIGAFAADGLTPGLPVRLYLGDRLAAVGECDGQTLKTKTWLLE